MAVTFIGVYIRRAGRKWDLVVRATEGWQPRVAFPISGPGLYPRAAWKALMEPRDPTERTFLTLDDGLLLGVEGEALVAAKGGVEVELPARLAVPALAAALDEAEGQGLQFSSAFPEGLDIKAAAGATAGRRAESRAVRRAERRADRLKDLASQYLKRCEGLERRLEEAEGRRGPERAGRSQASDSARWWLE